MKLDDFQKEILGICADDDIGLWVIIRRSEGDFRYPDKVTELVRRKTLLVIEDLLKSGLIEAGTFQEMIFRPFNMEVKETMQFIENKWDELGHRPSGGDVCWFRATSKGEQLALALRLNE